MGKIIAVSNQKGGVGKTTTAINLAASLAATKRKILLIDLDPQGNATTGSGVDKNEVEKSAYDIIIGGNSIEDTIMKDTIGKYDLIAGNSDIAGADVQLIDTYARELRLKRAIDPIKDEYDYIFIDCPPTLNLLTVNAMCAADSVLIPMQCEFYALEGIASLIETIDKIVDVINPSLKIEGILRTMVDSRSRLSNDVSDQLKLHFNDLVYKTTIPRNIRLAEAPSFGAPVMYYDKSSTGSKAYLALAGEILLKADKQ